MKFLPKRHEPEGMDMSPLIDMVFILLIFFAVSTTFTKDMQLALDRPSANGGSSASSESIRIYIDQEGEIFMDEQNVKSWMVQSLVRDSLAVSSSSSVLVIADKLTTTELLIDVIDQAKLAGASEVGVATEN